jgi:putative hydrolase of the HAD superfamily
MLDLIGFDADDTLWQNESLYLQAREQFRKVLAPYRLAGSVDETLHRIEIPNLDYYGYGVTGFVLSMIEAAIELTEGRIAGEDVRQLLDLAKGMLAAEVQLFAHAVDTLATLSASYALMLITKGALRHQRSKLARSGLSEYFSHVEVVSDKTPATYQGILDKVQVEPYRFVMIGNSMRSDILPVLELGGWAIHVPNDLTWSHEDANLPQRLRRRYFEAGGLGQLPQLIERLNGGKT